MKNRTIALVGIVVLLFATIGFVLGTKYIQRQQSQDNLNIRWTDDNRLIINGEEISEQERREKEKGRVRVWPFVDVEWDK